MLASGMMPDHVAAQKIADAARACSRARYLRTIAAGHRFFSASPRYSNMKNKRDKRTVLHTRYTRARARACAEVSEEETSFSKRASITIDHAKKFSRFRTNDPCDIRFVAG